ncbi:hypothetical protein SNOG_09366 [Parastagonospora nodorum SN15]|uniref:Uncharacterized protein n=1 Tax=Phaeosphaeria nodorum (strain SN15 / ATCC MYA-4574 / FGSC 10173) TaxID=321614 RepID=Q0UFU8_PHANO|nr:hypothetical protein SNOG_09366 [Parastagonospora nodorum SN15]EAT83558.1 hypothetical protein SNOG_09366 [Parastagonospora nodorum SN15]
MSPIDVPGGSGDVGPWEQSALVCAASTGRPGAQTSFVEEATGRTRS